MKNIVNDKLRKPVRGNQKNTKQQQQQQQQQKNIWIWN